MMTSQAQGVQYPAYIRIEQPEYASTNLFNATGFPDNLICTVDGVYQLLLRCPPMILQQLLC